MSSLSRHRDCTWGGMARRRKPSQGAFEFRGWGGKRRGAGRKSRSVRSNVSHEPREERSREFPAYVTLRLCSGLPSLRETDLFDVVLVAITASAFGLFFRIVEFSVQKSHLHLIVEASDSTSLKAGIKGFAARLTSKINAHLKRNGRVFADRYHLHVIETPSEARAVLLYVLGNARKHAREAEIAVPGDWIDPRSSGPWFRGWADAQSRYRRTDSRPVATARTWLLVVGWRRFGKPISVSETPAGKRMKRVQAKGPSVVRKPPARTGSRQPSPAKRAR